MPKSFANLTSLISLDLGYNPGLKGFDVFTELPELEYLDLSEVGLTKIPSSLLQLHNLEDVNFYGNSKLTDYTGIEELAHLEYLNFEGCPNQPEDVFLKMEKSGDIDISR